MEAVSRSGSLHALVRWCGCLLTLTLMAGCVSGPQSLLETRLNYNEVIKSTTEQQLLLNIVRLRYTDTPSSLSIANVAAQFELVKQLQLTPFFAPSAVDNRSFTSVLPLAGISYADRPTISLVPIDDAEFTRKLFTPLTLEGVLYLARTTWPISTVFRLYLENLNWVPNAEFASGPTPPLAPPFSDFAAGVGALAQLQASGRAVFSTEERFESLGGALPPSQVNAISVIEAAKNGFELRPETAGGNWMLGRRTRQPVLFIDPAALGTPEVKAFVSAFRLRSGKAKYDITVDALPPFTDGGGGHEVIDLETRSLLQAMYFAAHGVEVPPEHAASGVARTTLNADGTPFDWHEVTAGIFRARWSKGSQPPANAHVAVSYQGYWFYIPDNDHDTKATFSLLMELTRLDLQAKPGDRPLLTLPLSR